MSGKNNEQEQLLTMCTTWTMGNGQLLVMDQVSETCGFGVFDLEVLWRNGFKESFGIYVMILQSAAKL